MVYLWPDGTYCDTEESSLTEFSHMSDDYVVLMDGEYYIVDGQVIERRVLSYGVKPDDGIMQDDYLLGEFPYS